MRIGAAIRKYKATPPQWEDDESIFVSGHSTPKRPHLRRAHWHGFWTGPKQNPAQRKFILRWMAPMPIKMSQMDLPVTVKHVKD